jgi:hypothetical protein
MPSQDHAARSLRLRPGGCRGAGRIGQREQHAHARSRRERIASHRPTPFDQRSAREAAGLAQRSAVRLKCSRPADAQRIPGRTSHRRPSGGAFRHPTVEDGRFAPVRSTSVARRPSSRRGRSASEAAVQRPVRRPVCAWVSCRGSAGKLVAVASTFVGDRRRPSSAEVPRPARILAPSATRCYRRQEAHRHLGGRSGHPGDRSADTAMREPGAGKAGIGVLDARPA